MRELRPDLVLDTGDLLQPHPPATYQSELPKLAALFRSLQPPLGIYGVHGDVDGPLYGKNAKALGGLHVLADTETSFSYRGTHIRLLGLTRATSGDSTAARQRSQAWLYHAQKNDINLLIGHCPDFAMGVRDLPITVCLAGHTHGGQIRLPWFGPLVTMTHEIPRAWALGFCKIGRTSLDVSAGIGNEHEANLPAIRVNCPPEMTLIVLEPVKNTQ